MTDKTKYVPKVSKKEGGDEKAKKEVTAAPKGAKKAPKKQQAFTPEEIARTVVLRGCATKVTEASVLAQFPSAEQAKFWLNERKKFTGLVALRFKTKADAEAFVKNDVKVDGKTVQAEMARNSESREERARRKSEECSRRIYLSGLAPDVTPEEVQEAFPRAKAAQLLKNRKGEFTGQAFVYFQTANEAAAAVGHEVKVKGVKFTPGDSVYKSTGTTESPEERTKQPSETSSKRIRLSGLAPDVTPEELQKAFPLAKAARLLTNRKGEFTGQAFVYFQTANEAAAAVGHEVKVQGVKVEASVYKLTAAAKSKERKMARLESAAKQLTAPAKPKENKTASSDSAAQPSTEKGSAEKRKHAESAQATPPQAADPEVSKQSKKKTKQVPQ